MSVIEQAMRRPDVEAEPLLEVRGLTTHLGSASQPVRAVDDVSFAIRPGETFVLLGESGCGKSTLARMLVGLDRPSSGDIRLDGERVEAGDRKLARQIQYVFQDPIASLNPRKTVRDIVGVALRQRGLSPKGRLGPFALPSPCPYRPPALRPCHPLRGCWRRMSSLRRRNIG